MLLYRSLRKNLYKLAVHSQRNRMTSYEDAICALNNLQSNSDYLKKHGLKGNFTQQTVNTLVQVEKYLLRSGLTHNKLNELSVIHIAGTKGKGTTCALCESILRHHGYKTGFYSSPHLLEVRERIRIDGKPISKEEFAKYFWKIYYELDKQKSYECDMPLYFRFLTIMAFHVFLDNKVDVAIIEVGIGGEYDCTNIVQKVPIVGITSLGLDHTSLLGNDIVSIAWNKAGIMKEGCQAFSVPQPDDALRVLKDRSKERKCSLNIVQNNLNLELQDNGIPSNILSTNANLAILLCEAWIKRNIENNNLAAKTFSLDIAKNALKNCSWPGRYEIRRKGNITYHLDGAHTKESIDVCASWYKNVTEKSKNKKVLLFNLTGDRDSEKLLIPLQECRFDMVIFVPNVANADNKADNTNFQYNIDMQVAKCEQHKKIWLQMNDSYDPKNVHVFPTVSDAMNFLDDGRRRYDVLATGSIHLIGAVLSLLDPTLNGSL